MTDLSITNNFITGGLSGVVSWIIIHPLNTVTTRINLLTDNTKKGFFIFTRNIIKNEGPSTLYKGLSAGITRQVFYATSRLGLFDFYMDFLCKFRKIDFWNRMVVGVLSGGSAAIISCPAEIALVRMSNDASLPLCNRRNYRGMLDATIRITSEEGIATFWRSCVPFVNRSMLVGALQVGSYDQFKTNFYNMGVPQGLPITFCAAMSAGFICSFVTNPLESVKNRMAFQKPNPDGSLMYKTTVQSMKYIVKQEGMTALWKGFIPYYIRCGLGTVTMFVALEYIRKVFQMSV